MKYLVVDYYEGAEILYVGENANKARRAERERVNDTDGECDVRIYDSVHHRSKFAKHNIPAD